MFFVSYVTFSLPHPQLRLSLLLSINRFLNKPSGLSTLSSSVLHSSWKLVLSETITRWVLYPWCTPLTIFSHTCSLCVCIYFNESFVRTLQTPRHLNIFSYIPENKNSLQPWLVQLNGWSAGLRTEGLVV